MKFTKIKINIFLAIIGLLLLLSGCSKSINQGNSDEKSGITGRVIEDATENCRLSNESDCSPIEIRRGEQENEEDNNMQENAQETADVKEKTDKTINISEEPVLSNCEAGWMCVEAKYRAYKSSNCSWDSIEYCIYGCKNDTCNSAPICKSNSLKCDNDNVLKCEDGYEWTLNESCGYQCENGICISENETAQNTTDVSYDCINVLKYNLTGNKSTDEYFTLKNSCSYQIDMGGWTASDNANHVYTFPSFNLANNGEVTIVTGGGVNSQTTLYWGRGSAVWNNGGDTLYLNSSNGASVLIKILSP